MKGSRIYQNQKKQKALDKTGKNNIILYMGKECTKCKKTKLATEFVKNKAQEDGLSVWCRSCMKLAQRSWYIRNRACILEKAAVRYANMSGKDKKAFIERITKYKKTKRGKAAVRRYKSKPDVKFANKIRKKLKKSFIKNGWGKTSLTYKYIGLDKEEFKKHMENQFKEGMSWGNWGFDGWHLDHKLPLSAAKTEEEIGLLWHHTNLQPMWAEENIAKGGKYCPKELEAFLEERRAADE